MARTGTNSASIDKESLYGNLLHYLHRDFTILRSKIWKINKRGRIIRHQNVEHLKISLKVKMMNIIDIKADDIFMGNISTDVIWSKVRLGVGHL